MLSAPLNKTLLPSFLVQIIYVEDIATIATYIRKCHLISDLLCVYFSWTDLADKGLETRHVGFNMREAAPEVGAEDEHERGEVPLHVLRRFHGSGRRYSA